MIDASFVFEWKVKIFGVFREAEATRNALHGVHWPIGNGKKLMIEYANVEDLEMAKNPPAPPVVPIPEVPEKTVEKENKVRSGYGV